MDRFASVSSEEIDDIVQNKDEIHVDSLPKPKAQITLKVLFGLWHCIHSEKILYHSQRICLASVAGAVIQATGRTDFEDGFT